MRTAFRHAFTFALLCGLAAAQPAITAVAAGKPLLQAGKKTLFQRVLTTPGCRLTDSPGASSGKEQPAFSRFYVYERKKVNNTEWLHLGPDSFGKLSGWMNADCTVEWKMQMTLAFTNPAGRDPMLFFRKRDTLDQILASPDPAPILKPIREALAKNGHVPQVVAEEPEYAVDLKKQFYLLPVLDAEEILTEEGFRVRLLDVASVSKPPEKSKAAGGVVPGKNATNATGQQISPASTEHMLKGFTAAVVFVIDSTLSMGPYIDRTRAAIRKVYTHIEQEHLLNQVKFGLVAYRSSVKAGPGWNTSARCSSILPP